MEQLTNSWFTIEKIDNFTYAISEYGHWEQVHSYLILGTKKAALIDTGLGIGHIKNITDQLTNLPIIVFTTHVHWDHIGGHSEFSDIYVHKNEANWLENGIPGLSSKQIKKDVIRDITIPTPDEFDIENYLLYRGLPTRLLENGDIIDLGNRLLKIYHTPGHSPGHIAILDETTGYLFSGDLLYDKTPIYAFYPTTSPVDLVNSLELVSNLKNITKIFPGHNTLMLNPNLFLEVKRAVTYLRENNLTHFGTGIHKFNGFSIQF